MSGEDESRKDGVQRLGDPNRAILWAIIGVGVGLAILLVTVAGSLNARFNEVNVSIDDLNARLDNVNARMDNLQDDIRELRGLVVQALNESPAAD